jgi:hypothetical protein
MIDRDAFLRILPQLIREDDTIREAIITALSGVMATHEDVQNLTQEMRTSFDASERRFEALQAEMRAGFEASEHTRATINDALGNFWARAGVRSEKAFHRLLRFFLELNLSDPILENMGLVETDAARNTVDEGEIDVVVHNGRVYLVELKFLVQAKDVQAFIRNIQLYEKLHGPYQEAIIAAAAEDRAGDARRYAQRAGITFIVGDAEDEDGYE